MKEEWGPWVQHNGNGCPLKTGTWIMSESRDGLIKEHPALCFLRRTDLPEYGLDAWTWDGSYHPDEIVRYRIRKPKGLTILEEIASSLVTPQEKTPKQKEEVR